jgi:hypothetical protein
MPLIHLVSREIEQLSVAKEDIADVLLTDTAFHEFVSI